MSAELLLVRAFAAGHPEEVARFVERLPPENAAEVLGALDLESAAQVLSRTVPLVAAAAVSRLEAKPGGDLLEACHPTLAADILFRMHLEIFEPEGGAPLATQLDGEEWPAHRHVHIQVAARAIRLIVPAAAAR